MIGKEDIDKILNNANDLYGILGVDKSATKNEIEKSFRKLSVKWHPDKLKVKEPELLEKAQEVFKKLSEAKEILTDPEKRETYDRYGMDGFRNNGGPEGMGVDPSDMMEEMMKMFGKKNKAETEITIVESFSLEELYMGKTYSKTIDCYMPCINCNGNGTDDGKDYSCPDCKGMGFSVKIMQAGFTVQQIRKTCSLCQGTGQKSTNGDKIKKCKSCDGNKKIKEKTEIKIQIPKGSYEGIGITIPNAGNYINKDKRSNIVIQIKEKEHPEFIRGFTIPEYKLKPCPEDLMMKMKITLAESLTGFTKTINFFNNKSLNIVHEKLIKHNDVLKIPKHGMPVLKTDTFGDLYIVFEVEYPDDLTNATKRRLWQLLTNNPYKELSEIKNKVLLHSVPKIKNHHNSYNDQSSHDSDDDQPRPTQCAQQ